jgi:glyoxylase-like metal-dependent hydrolase (beta-lactamase superfamily II)
MSVLTKVLPGIWKWSVFSEEKGLNFNGHLLIHGDELVLIDPPELDEDGLQDLHILIERHPDAVPRAILLTNAHHDRYSFELAEQLSIPVCIHSKDAELLPFSPAKTFLNGDSLFCDLKVVSFENQKTPGESAFLLEESDVLFVGDALISKTQGRVQLLPDDKYENVELAKKGLRVLKDLKFETLLLGDGEAILAGAKETVVSFLNE